MKYRTWRFCFQIPLPALEIKTYFISPLKKGKEIGICDNMHKKTYYHHSLP